MTRFDDPFRPSRARYVARAVRATLADPSEGLEKVLEKFARAGERIAHRGATQPAPGFYASDPQWERHLHELCGEAWPCPLASEFAKTWSALVATMAASGLRVGRQNYGGDDDGDRGLARALWCIVRHTHCRSVVETGVGHGVTTRALLEALEANGSGSLASIDLPPLTITARQNEIAAAIPVERRARWRYVRGSSRSQLGHVVAALGGELGLFVHDSRHSTRNVLFECERALTAIRPGGFMVVDDLDGNWGFDRFRARHPELEVLIAAADDGQRRIGIARVPSEP